MDIGRISESARVSVLRGLRLEADLTKIVRIIVLILLDAAAFNLSWYLSFLIRFEMDMSDSAFNIFFPAYTHNFIWLTLIKALIFFVLGMYRSLWDYAGPEELLKVVGVSIVATLTSLAFLTLIQQDPAMPRSIFVVSFVLDTILAGGIRFSFRYARGHRNTRGFGDFFRFSHPSAEKRRLAGGADDVTRIMLIGAGDAGASIIKEIKASSGRQMRVEIAVDDNPSKQGQTILGVKIAGGSKQIQLLARRHGISEIIIAIPSASRKQIQAIVSECNKTSCKIRILPSMMDLIDERVSVSALRDVDIEDLLGRDPVRLNIKEISGYIEGRIIMVTGGGGSIGSELCRQIAAFRPRRLIALDNYENSVFELGGELKAIHPELEFETAVGTVRDRNRMAKVFEKYRPHVVFHAAAHKHVPLMEYNPGEAVANNVLGTKHLADIADEYAVEKFVMISTDKAVNPTNVMGATKRLAEMIVQEKSQRSQTVFAVVRFGNVLGSNGSVIPIFRKQIERGGPVTVTDKDITRYFMTIPEAAQLVIQAGAMAEGGEIFILDMGEPVRILDLAENLIKLSGLRPYEDIDIAFTQLRPGEKIHEELSYAEEYLRKTTHDKIFLGRATEPSPLLAASLGGDSAPLEQIISNGVANMDEQTIKAWLQKFLPEYKAAKPRSELRGIRGIE